MSGTSRSHSRMRATPEGRKLLDNRGRTGKVRPLANPDEAERLLGRIEAATRPGSNESPEPAPPQVAEPEPDSDESPEWRPPGERTAPAGCPGLGLTYLVTAADGTASVHADYNAARLFKAQHGGSIKALR